MTGRFSKSGLIKLQNILIAVIVLVFVVSIVTALIDRKLAEIFYYISLLLLLLSAPIRLLWMSEYFRRERDSQYQFFSYLVVVIIVATAIYKIMF